MELFDTINAVAFTFGYVTDQMFNSTDAKIMADVGAIKKELVKKDFPQCSKKGIDISIWISGGPELRKYTKRDRGSSRAKYSKPIFRQRIF